MVCCAVRPSSSVSFSRFYSFPSRCSFRGKYFFKMCCFFLCAVYSMDLFSCVDSMFESSYVPKPEFDNLNDLNYNYFLFRLAAPQFVGPRAFILLTHIGAIIMTIST